MTPTTSTSRRLVKRTSLTVDRLAALLGRGHTRHPHATTLLVYHRVGADSDSDVDLPVDEFRRQLDYLAEYTEVVDLDTAVAALGAPDCTSSTASGNGSTNGSTNDSSTNTRPRVVLTFDDGTADFTDHAVPALVDADLPATLYVATHFIDTGDEFPWHAPPTTWAALSDAVATGLVTIGSHTHRHHLLDRIDPADAATDLDRSIESITTHLGHPPVHFAYPKAIPASPAVEVAVRRRFRTAALAANRVNVPGHTDLHRLWRTPIQRSDDPQYFAAKAAGGMRLEGALRVAAARVKYATESQ